jgi:hypothetical protein
LSSSELKAKIKRAQNDVASLETSVRDAVAQWEKSQRSLKENPVIALEKRLWKNFATNPEAMEQSIIAMKSKNNT